VATTIPGFNPVRLFLLGGFVKDAVFVPPLPANLQIFATVITAAVTLVDRDMPTRVWNEMGCRVDVCRISKSEHNEHLWNMYKKNLEIFSVYRRKNCHDTLSSLFVTNF
jgi:hypothetical protein